MEYIAQKVGLSMTSFYRRFNEEVFMTPGQYLIQRRIHRAKILLCDSAMSITTIAHTLGYSSSQYFATTFKRVAGVTPHSYRATSLMRPPELS
jgi:AraC family transcriptional regulator